VARDENCDRVPVERLPGGPEAPWGTGLLGRPTVSPYLSPWNLAGRKEDFLLERGQEGKVEADKPELFPAQSLAGFGLDLLRHPSRGLPPKFLRQRWQTLL